MKPDDILNALVAALGQRMQAGGGMPAGAGAGPFYRDVAPSTPSVPYYTGPASLFGVAGLERDIISTRIQPMGLADRLPVQPTNMMTPLFPYFTGFTDDVGAEASGVCDDPPTVGAGKNCIQTAQFGRFSRQTRTLEINRLGQQMNRGEFQDLRFMNDPLVGGMGGITMPTSTPTGGINPRQEALMRFLELGASIQLWMARKIFDANPANDTGGGGYREFPGLDILIGTNKVDALTNVDCPSLDSDIKNAAYRRVDSNGPYFVQTLAAMMRYLKWNATQMNFGNVTWAFVMRPSLFYELTAVWPCVYMTDRCQVQGPVAGGNPNTNGAFVDAGDMITMRDNMRTQQYLLIDGERFNVILDSNIPEESNTSGPANVTSGCFASDVYVVPLTVRGGIPVTYWETFDYRTSMAIANQVPMPANFFWTDGGRYLWHFKPPNNFCLQWLVKIEPRLILRTPQLAGRLTNVMYCPLQHERDAQPDDPYYVNGGNSTGRSMATLHADWGVVKTT